MRRVAGHHPGLIRQRGYGGAAQRVVGVARLFAALADGQRHLTVAVVAPGAAGPRHGAIRAQRRDGYRVALLVGDRAHASALQAAVRALRPGLLCQGDGAGRGHAHRTVRRGQPVPCAPRVVADAGRQDHVPVPLPVREGGCGLAAQRVPADRRHVAPAPARRVGVLPLIAHDAAEAVIPGARGGPVSGAPAFGPGQAPLRVHTVGVAAGGRAGAAGVDRFLRQAAQRVVGVRYRHLTVRPGARRLAVGEKVVGDADRYRVRLRLRPLRRAAEAAGGGPEGRQRALRHALIAVRGDEAGARRLTGCGLGDLQRQAVAGEVAGVVYPVAQGGFEQRAVARAARVRRAQGGEGDRRLGQPVAVAAAGRGQLHVGEAGFQRGGGVARRQCGVTLLRGQQAAHGQGAGEALRVGGAQQGAVFADGVAVARVPLLLGHRAAGVAAAGEVAVLVVACLLRGLPYPARVAGQVPLLRDALRHLVEVRLLCEGELLVRVICGEGAGHRDDGHAAGRGQGAGDRFTGLQVEAVVGARHPDAGVAGRARFGDGVLVGTGGAVEVVQAVVAPADAVGTEAEEVAAGVGVFGEYSGLAAAGVHEVAGDARQVFTSAAGEGVAVVAADYGLGGAGGALHGGDAADAAQRFVGKAPLAGAFGHDHGVELPGAAGAGELEGPGGRAGGGQDAVALAAGVEGQGHHVA